ncbi:MAG: HAMP domain-containing histidine kinase [Lachnospira sp.]|nr:HAMP domain-containing histidine kinase [Lachnospira sp.]
MKSFNRIIIIVVFLLCATILIGNIGMHYFSNVENNRQYRVDISRVVKDIEEQGFDKADISRYEVIKGIYEVELNEDVDNTFFESNSDYVIKQIGNKLYRIEYISNNQVISDRMITVINVLLAVMATVVISVLIYVRQKILKPFDVLKEVPYELSKGNLTIPVKESKNRFFGRFVWGVDLLREHMEEQRERELELLKEKKTLVLALSHDIKTPLSAIKLYSKALSRGLYSDADKQAEIANNIDSKADEIEGYVSDIIKASKEDFIDLSVEQGEFYLQEAVNSIVAYYKDKLGMIKIDFVVGEYTDCIIKGDLNRFVEVLQNIVENAIKYGDGSFIQLDFSSEEDCRLITVKNSGCTLPENEIAHMFDSFWRGSNSDGCKGSGLGLYICRKLMQGMDGEVYAQIDEEKCMCVTVVARQA